MSRMHSPCKSIAICSVTKRLEAPNLRLNNPCTSVVLRRGWSPSGDFLQDALDLILSQFEAWWSCLLTAFAMAYYDSAAESGHARRVSQS